MHSPSSSLARLNILGFSLTIATLALGLAALVTASWTLTLAALGAQLAAMVCFTLARK